MNWIKFAYKLPPDDDTEIFIRKLNASEWHQCPANECWFDVPYESKHEWEWAFWKTMNEWMPIETAPKDKSLMLCCGVAKYDTQLIYCGRYRIGTMGEPQAHVIAWRCDSSGRFSNPTHWMPLPPVPTGEQTDDNPESIG